MPKFRIKGLVAVAAVVAMVGAACSDSSSSTSVAGGTTSSDAAAGVCATVDAAAGDLLSQVCQEGTITVSTDPAYPPQSFLNEDSGVYEGFDIDVATEIATRLGVDIGWETPNWGVLTAGSWGDRWEMSVGSMTPIDERQEVLRFTEPYYYTPAVVVVPADSDLSDTSTDLDGKNIGVASSTTYQYYLEKTLAIEGFPFDFVIDDATITGYNTDTLALADLSAGRLDAAITSATTAQGYIDDGNAVQILGDPVFFEPLSVAFDKSSSLDSTSLEEAVDGIVAEMHEDGTLSSMSQEWFNGLDLTTS